MHPAVAAPPEGWSAEILLREMLRLFSGRIALVSSFGTESAVLLHMLACIDPATPIIFLDTGKLFPETLQYRDLLATRFGLSDLRIARPDVGLIAHIDLAETLWSNDPDLCCWLRKVEPLDEALTGFAAWITGRKRYHGGMRRDLPLVESGPDGRTKINPLAEWSTKDIESYFTQHKLPRHPLTTHGYSSIGCITCTRATNPGEHPRDGRWTDIGKSECGIHLPRPISRPIPAI